MAENRIRVVIDGDASDLERELRSAGGAVTTFGRQVSGSSRGVSAFNAVADQQVRNLQQIGRYAMYAGQGVAVAGGALALWAGKQGIQFNATMETNRMALSQFLGSTKEADRFLKQLFETAKKGPFEFAGITDAARKLLAFDFSKGEATETLNAISDSVAALGGSADLIDRVVIAMGQIQAKGRVQGDELLQLAEAGIPAYQILQEKLHLTADEVKNIGNAGITADEAIGALVSGMEDRFGGAARRQAKTFSGQMSTLQDNFDQLMGAMTKGLFEEMKDWLPVVNQTAEDIAAIWNRKDITPEQKFKESRDTIERELGPLATMIEGEIGDLDLPGKFADALSAALPVMAESGGKLGLAVAEGTIEGFLKADVWGKLLIGGWLFTKLGGFAAMNAAGVGIGRNLLAGISKSMATGQAVTQVAEALGAGPWASRSAGVRVAGQGMATALMGSMARAIPAAAGIYAVSDVASVFATQGLVPGMEKAGKVGAGALVGGIVGSLTGGPAGTAIGAALGAVMEPAFEEALGSLGGDDEAAKWVQNMADSIAGGQRARIDMTPAFMEMDLHRAKEVTDATGEQYAALRKLYQLAAQSRNLKVGVGLDMDPKQLKNLSNGFRQLKSGAVTEIGDITKVTGRNMRLIKSQFGEGTSEGRKLIARNMRLAAAAMKNSLHDMGGDTSKGMARVRSLIRGANLRAPTQKQAQAFGAEWAKGMNSSNKITKEGFNRMIKEAKLMPPKMRALAIETWESQVSQAKKNGKITADEFDRMRSRINATFTGLPNDVKRPMSQFQSTLDQSVNRADRAMDALTRRGARLNRDLGGSFKRLPVPVGAGINTTIKKVNAGLQAVGSDELIEVGLGFAGGGVMRVPGTGTADSVPLVGSGIKAVVAPGEDLAVFNRHQRPMVDAALQNTYGVSGLGGFFSKYDRPHYMARGGMAGDDFNLPKATLTGTPDTAREMGQKGLDEFHKYALKYYKAHAKVVSGGNIVEVGHSLQRLGYEVSENPAFGGVAPVHAEGSYHYSGRAIDVNDDAAPYGHGSSEKASLDWLYPQLQKLPHVELLWQVADHFDHLHFAMNRGGLFQFMSGGGKASKGIWEGTSIDRTYPKSDGYSGAKLAPYLIKALAEWAGLPGVTMEQITQGESMGHPGVDISDPPGRSRGLYAINDHYNPQYGAADMRNPILNTMAAADLARAVGGPNSNIWHGSGHVTGWNLHYDATPEKLWRIAKSLGGGGAGGDGEDSASANRLKARQKAIAQLRGRAKGTSNPKAREQILWQLIDAYARWGDFDKGKGKEGNRFNEWRHLRDTAYNIAAMKNPNMGAGKLSQLAKWLDNHVEITGREKENAGLERRLENTRERGGKKAGKRRKSFFKRLVRDIAGLDPYERNWFRYNTDQIERLEEQISLAEQQHSGAWSEGGSDYTEKEIATEVDLNTRLKERMASRIGKYSSALAAARGYKSIFESKIAQARKDPKQRWKIPAFRRGLKQAEAALSRLRDDRETMIGVTGRGGDFRQVQFRLRELGVMDSTEDQAAAARDSELNTILKEQLIQSQRGFALGQAQYAVFKDFLGGVDSPFLGAFAMGTAGRRVGRTGLAVLHENEVVTPDPKGPYGQNMSTVSSSGAAPRVEITVAGDVAPLINKIDARIDGKVAQVTQKVNSTLGRERRQLAYAPGR